MIQHWACLEGLLTDRDMDRAARLHETASLSVHPAGDVDPCWTLPWAALSPEHQRIMAVLARETENKTDLELANQVRTLKREAKEMSATIHNLRAEVYAIKTPPELRVIERLQSVIETAQAEIARLT